jgi:tetratricopeptide (TPR) repeat protein
MGLFDLFKSNPKKKSELTTKPKREVINSYQKLKNETDRLRTENELWQTDFNKVLDFRNKATKLEKSGKLSMAIDSYLNAMDFGEKSTKLSINNYSHDIERIIILYGKTKETENLISFLQKVISTYPEYRDVKKWAVRLSKLTVKDTKKTTELKPSDITKQIAGNPTIGEQFENFKNTLPEFNFYHDLPAGMQTFEYLRLNKTIPTNKAKDLRNFRESFKIILSKAKIAENQKDYKTAIEAYEKLIVEEYEGKEPYERLMVIFRKLKWLEKEEDILKRAISFFEKLKEKQKNNVLSLAKKYRMESKALEYLNADKEIQYFGGVFDLYNPNPTIEKWKLQLEKKY